MSISYPEEFGHQDWLEVGVLIGKALNALQANTARRLEMDTQALLRLHPHSTAEDHRKVIADVWRDTMRQTRDSICQSFDTFLLLGQWGDPPPLQVSFAQAALEEVLAFVDQLATGPFDSPPLRTIFALPKAGVKSTAAWLLGRWFFFGHGIEEVVRKEAVRASDYRRLSGG